MGIRYSPDVAAVVQFDHEDRVCGIWPYTYKRLNVERAPAARLQLRMTSGRAGLRRLTLIWPPIDRMSPFRTDLHQRHA